MLTTRAVTYPGTGDRVEVTELVLDPPGLGEVLVQIRASGVCGSDRHVLDGDWTVPSPAIMGHEAAGIVRGLGEGVVGLSEGDHVIIAWHQACQRCAECTSGKPWACRLAKSNNSLLPDGTTRFHTGEGKEYFPYLAVGSMSEYTVVPEWAAIKVSAEVPFDVASLIGCSVGTGIGAVVNNARVQAGSSAVVVGTGGVGLSIIAGLVVAGANPIIAVDVSADKLKAATEFGATHTVLASSDVGGDVAGQVAEITDGGADYAFEAIGRVATMESLPDLIRPGGSAVFVGLPAEGTKVGIDALALAEDGKTIIGSNYGGLVPQRDFPRIAELYLAGRLPLDSLISDRISLDEVNEAFDAMRRGERTRSVIILGSDE